MLSTFVGRTGRVYLRDKILKVHPHKPEYNVYLAHCENQRYVVKKVSPSIFELSQKLRHQFGSDPRLRTHLDDNEDGRILVYEHFKENLLSLINKNPLLSLQARKHILREVAYAIQTLHSAHWIHLDLKPDNILLNWTLNEAGRIEVGRVTLADLDCALKLKGSKLLNHIIGNVMWRSPEGQAGKGVGRSSEVFSYGLMCFYTITGAELLHPDFKQLEQDGVEPEHVVLYRLLSMFGPAPPELLMLIDDEDWSEFLTKLFEATLEDDSAIRFENWREGMLPNLDCGTKQFIMKMTDLNPAKRMTISDILNDPWWEE